MYKALDKIMGNPVQSYDEFVNSFTFLKQEMLKRNEKITNKKDGDVKTKKTRDTEGKNSSAFQNQASLKSVPAEIVAKGDRSLISQDIEVEILSDGDSSNRLLKSKAVRTGTLVKVDNYVENLGDGDDDIEEIPCTEEGEGYFASFSTDARSRRDNMAADEKADINQPQSADVPEGGDLCQVMESGLSLEENSTDKLLLNFLADLQNEMNEGQGQSVQGQTSVGRVEAASEAGMDIQTFINRKDTKRNTGSASDFENARNVNFDDDSDGDALQLLCDDSGKNDVKVTVNKKELSRMSENDKLRLQQETSKLNAIYRDSLMDSEGNIRTVTTSESEDKESDQGEVALGSFPGQVEEQNDMPATSGQTVLEFKGIPQDPAQNVDCGSKDEEVCMVQSFQLDEDHDYDSFVLIPKFSAEDLQQLKIQPQQAVL